LVFRRRTRGVARVRGRHKPGSDFRSSPGADVLAAARLGAAPRYALLKEFPLRARPRRWGHSPAVPPADPAAAGIVEGLARPGFRRGDSDDRPSADIVEADFFNPERDLARLALSVPVGRHILGDPKPRAGCATTLAARGASDRGRERAAWNAPGARRRPLFLHFHQRRDGRWLFRQP